MSAPTLDALWAQVADFQDATFPAGTTLGAARHLAREAMEIVTDAEAYDLAATSRSIVRPMLVEECADAWFMLRQTLGRAGVDLPTFAAAIAAKLATNQARQWPTSPDAAGVFSHIAGDEA